MENTTSAFSAEGLQPLITSMKAAITPAELVSTLAVLFGIGIGFVLMWFGVRKALSIFKNNVMKGKMKI